MARLSLSLSLSLSHSLALTLSFPGRLTLCRTGLKYSTGTIYNNAVHGMLITLVGNHHEALKTFCKSTCADLDGSHDIAHELLTMKTPCPSSGACYRSTSLMRSIHPHRITIGHQA